MNRRAAVLIGAAIAASAAVACGPKRIGSPSQPGRVLVALLPDAETGTVGRINVSNASGALDLTGSRQATTIEGGGPPAPATILSEDEVRRMFGEALSALPPPPSLFTLYFQFESNELTPESRKLLPDILERFIKARPAPDVLVIGHTDTTGSAETNLALGLKRAAAVRSILVESGIDAALVEVTSHGEGDPIVQTADNTPEPRNRRVDITVR